MSNRRQFLLAGTAVAAFVLPGLARAHHGWAWTESGEFQLTGIIREVRLGNPHGELTVEAEDEIWIAEIGQPWRNARAGLTDNLLAPGVEVTLLGHRSADPDELRMKAERVVIGGTMYVLYPDRTG
jgi:hypothetical protein